jgi:hypothetical protein
MNNIKMSNKNDIKGDYKQLEDVLNDGDLTAVINKIKPTIGICNRFLHKLQQSKDDNFDQNVKIVLDYVEIYKINKDRGFYHIAIQCLVNSMNLERQEKYIKEMLDNNIKTKTSTYIPLIETSFQIYVKTGDWKFFKYSYEILQTYIIDKTLIMTDELYLILIKYMTIAYHTKHNLMELKIYFIELLKSLSKYVDIINIDIYTELTKFIGNLTMTTSPKIYKIGVHNQNDYKEILHRRYLGNEIYQRLKEEWENKFNDQPKIKKELNGCIKNCKFHNNRLLDKTKPIILIDGANVGYYINRKRNKSKLGFYKQIDAAAQYFYQKGWNVIIFLYKTHLIDLESTEISQYVDSWKNPSKNIIRYDVKGCQDDIIWMMAGFYYNIIRPQHDVYVLSNDMMRNHHGHTMNKNGKKYVIDNNISKLSQREFFQWRDNHQISYNIEYKHTNNYPTFVPIMPAPYSHYVHTYTSKDNKFYNIYIPFNNEKISKKNERGFKAELYNNLFYEQQKTTQWFNTNIDLVNSFQ